MNTSHKTFMAACLFSLLSSSALAQSSGIAWKNGNVLTAQQMQQLDNAKMNISSLGKPGFAPKLNALGKITNPVVGDVSGATATSDGKTVSQISQLANGSVQKADIGKANSAAPTDANAMMSAPVSGDTSASPATAKNASIGRPIAEHFGDYLDIRDFGALLDGKADDTAALQAVKDAATDGQTIMVPPVVGSNNIINTGKSPTSTPDKTNFWWLFGKTYSNGYPLSGFGYDPVFSTINNGFWFHRDRNIADKNGYLLRMDDNYDSGGGTEGSTVGIVQPTCRVGAFVQHNYVWCGNFTVSSSSQNAQNLAIAANAVRPNDALSDGNGPRGQIWSLFSQTIDQTGKGPNYSGSMVGYEMDLSGNGVGSAAATNGVSYGRMGLQMAIATDTSHGSDPFGMSEAFDIGSNDTTSYYYQGIRLHTRVIDSALDTTGVERWTPFAQSSGDTPAGSRSIKVVNTQNGIYAGLQIVGTGIPDRTVVMAVDYNTNTVTLSQATTADIPDNTTIAFQSDFTPIKLADGQPISFDANKTYRLLHANGALHYSTNGLPVSNGSDVFSVTDDGTVNLSGTVNPAKGVALPNMTTAQIKALTGVPNAMEVYDTDTKTVAIYVDGTWHQIALGDSL